jgi:hypothetical protein
MAPREQKRAISKIMVNQRRNEPPCYHRLAHHLAFTKSAQEPRVFENEPTLRLWAIFGEAFLQS